MLVYLRGTAVYIPMRTHADCLAGNPLTKESDRLTNITPEKPSWLNDYWVATALESLHLSGKAAKAELYVLDNTWPPSKAGYHFELPKPGKTIEEQAEELEAESRCRVEQFPPWRDFSSCSEVARYCTVGYAETVDATTVQHRTRTTLKPNAPPCDKCWIKEGRKQTIKRLVESITEHDLASTATEEITGINQEFQEAVASVCIDSDCGEDAISIREIVKQAIEIRRNQIGAVATGQATDWPECLTSEFKALLCAHIKEKSR